MALRALGNKYVHNWAMIRFRSLIVYLQNRGLGKGNRYNHTPVRSTWKKHNTLSLRRYR